MKIILVISALLLGFIGNAQTYKLYQTENFHNQLKLNTKTGEVYQVQDDGQKFLVHQATTPENEKSGRYRLFKTENMWTYLLLDRFTGKLWQCQYSVQGIEYINSWIINSTDLSTSSKSRFTIQPMTSMYQFYLINEETGDMWKFQWATKGDEFRWIEKI